MRMLLLVIFVASVLLISGCTIETQSPSIPLDDPEQECRKVGRNWVEFPNTCVDSCESVRSAEPLACGQALTHGCDCGPERCWNGRTCEENQIWLRQ